MAKNNLDIPKAPIYHVSLTCSYESCPNCKAENKLSIDHYTYFREWTEYLERCPDCGQLLDWDDDAVEKATIYSKSYKEYVKNKEKKNE